MTLLTVETSVVMRSGAHRHRLLVEPVEELVVRGGLAVGIRATAKRLTPHPLVRYTFCRSPNLL